MGRIDLVMAEEKEEEKAPYHYVVVREDIPLDALVVNVGHACGESVVEAPISKKTRLVLLKVADEAKLLEEAERARAKGFQVEVVYEPDPPYNGAAMAFALAPSTKRNQLRKHFYHVEAMDLTAFKKAFDLMVYAILAKALKG